MDKIGVIAMVVWVFMVIVMGITKAVNTIKDIKRKSKCKHMNKILMRTDYQDRYHLYGCVDCGEDLYEGME